MENEVELEDLAGRVEQTESKITSSNILIQKHQDEIVNFNTKSIQNAEALNDQNSKI